MIIGLPPVTRSRAATTASALAAVLLGACGPGVSADPLDPPPRPGACGLADPAFCDTFDQPSPGGRGGDLDERFWSVGRLSQLTNVSQGENNPFPLATAAACDGARTVGPDGSDYFFCAAPGHSSGLRQAFNDGGGIILHSFHARRLFDFAGRVGTVAFSVDAWTSPGAWIEVWIADEPVSAIHTTLPGMDPLPRTGIGLVFQQCGTESGLQNVLFVSDHQVTRTIDRVNFDEGACFAAVPEALNRMEVRLGEHTVEVRASAPGDPGSLQRVALISGLDLPLDRGYVHFETLGNNAGKTGGSSDHTRVWDDIAFDGPFLPLPHARDIPDHLEWWAGAAPAMTVQNTAYVLLPTNQQTFKLEGLDVRAADQAVIDLSAFGLSVGGGLRFRFNGRTWREWPYPFESDSWRAVSIPVSIGDLTAGTNTLELATASASTATVLVANVDLTVLPR
jgi:hypothetical protein